MEFPTSPTNGQRFTNFGRVYEYSISKNAWFPVGSSLSITDIIGVDSVSSPTIGDILISDGNTMIPSVVPAVSVSTPYATALTLPLTGNSAGDIASVTETNSLYVWNGTAWYSINIADQSPIIP